MAAMATGRISIKRKDVQAYFEQQMLGMTDVQRTEFEHQHGLNVGGWPLESEQHKQQRRIVLEALRDKGVVVL